MPWLSIWRIGSAKLTKLLTKLMHGVRTWSVDKFSPGSPTCPLHKLGNIPMTCPLHKFSL